MNKKMTFELIDGELVERKRTFLERFTLNTPPFIAPLIVLICFALQIKIAFLAYPILKALISLIP
jgi:hypothetical protein